VLLRGDTLQLQDMKVIMVNAAVNGSKVPQIGVCLDNRKEGITKYRISIPPSGIKSRTIAPRGDSRERLEGKGTGIMS